MIRHETAHGTAGATFSDDGHYRYSLWRRWSDAPPLGFLMLNPSTATHEQDDPTIRRCVGFARREKAGGVVVVNLSPFRATDPRQLYRLLDKNPKELNVVCPPEGRDCAWTGLIPCGRVVAAFGGFTGASFQARSLLQVELGCFWEEANERGRALWCLGLTRDGWPRHPLYMHYSAPLTRWAPPGALPSLEGAA